MRASQRLGLVFIFVILPAIKPPFANDTLVLTPQKVVDLVLERGQEAKLAELKAQRAYLQLAEAQGVFDFNLKLTSSFESTEAETLSGSSNPEDRTTKVGLLLSKKLTTGSKFELAYDQVHQDSKLSVFTANIREPKLTQDVTSLSLRQDIWRNAFGFADRLSVEIGQKEVYRAKEGREEELETILLQAMTNFWDAYTAAEQLKQNMAAREKYASLVKTVRSKNRFNLTAPGELSRLETEYALADQRVKESSATYLNSVDKLLISLQLPTGQPVEFQVEHILPPVPQLEPKKVDDLRALKVAKALVESRKATLERQENMVRPRFEIVAKAASTGVETSSDRAFSEMVASTHPTYYIGIEFETPLDSKLQRGQVADARVSYEEARVQFEKQRQEVTYELVSGERNVAAHYALAKSAEEVVKLRRQVVKDVEAGYRQGRQPMVELIRAYNDLFQAEQDRARAIGVYHNSLNKLAAVRDELITNSDKGG